MTLDEFTNEAQQELQRFREMWTAQQALHGTQNWPADQLSGDWWEQFMFFGAGQAE